MTSAICEQPETTCRLRRMREIDRMTEAELEAMTPDDLGEIRRLLLETLKQDLKKCLTKISGKRKQAFPSCHSRAGGNPATTQSFDKIAFSAAGRPPLDPRLRGDDRKKGPGRKCCQTL